MKLKNNLMFDTGTSFKIQRGHMRHSSVTKPATPMKAVEPIPLNSRGENELAVHRHHLKLK